jgi:hypothetical protein
MRQTSCPATLTKAAESYFYQLERQCPFGATTAGTAAHTAWFHFSTAIHRLVLPSYPVRLRLASQGKRHRRGLIHPWIGWIPRLSPNPLRVWNFRAPKPLLIWLMRVNMDCSYRLTHQVVSTLAYFNCDSRNNFTSQKNKTEIKNVESQLKFHDL